MCPAGERLDPAELERHARDYPQNAAVVASMLRLLQAGSAAFSRRELKTGHFTASAFVLSPDRGRVLLIHHQKLGRWLQPGGHIEPGDLNLAATARREVVEETGVRLAAPLGSGIFDVDIHVIPQNPKDGAHRHFDVRYAFLAESDALEASPEVLGARWVELDAAPTLTDEDSVLRCVARLAALG